MTRLVITGGTLLAVVAPVTGTAEATATTAGLTSWTWTARRGTNTTRPMVRSTSEAPTTASGSTSRGKYTFETRSPSSMMALTPPPTAVANIIQTTMPAQTKDR